MLKVLIIICIWSIGLQLHMHNYIRIIKQNQNLLTGVCKNVPTTLRALITVFTFAAEQ